MNIDGVLGGIESLLVLELADGAIARALTEALHEDALSWHAPEIGPARVDTIMAFTFGNRLLPNGNRAPGPVNEALADVVARLHREKGAPVYAQWEVAEAVGARVLPDKLTAIFPGRDDRAEPVYLSTSDVVSAVVARTRDPQSLGIVGVVAFRDHLWRCVATARRFGLDAYAPSDFAMPCDYDPQSGQPWCRSRLVYLMHDIMIRTGERRGRLAEQA